MKSNRHVEAYRQSQHWADEQVTFPSAEGANEALRFLMKVTKQSKPIPSLPTLPGSHRYLAFVIIARDRFSGRGST